MVCNVRIAATAYFQPEIGCECGAANVTASNTKCIYINSKPLLSVLHLFHSLIFNVRQVIVHLSHSNRAIRPIRPKSHSIFLHFLVLASV